MREDVPSLRSKRLVRELERSFTRACDRGDFRLIHYSIQKDHAHLVVEAKNAEALGRGMKSIGARFARAVNRVFEREGPVLGDRYHSRALRTPREVRAVLRYVLLNARRHGVRARPSWIDPASSGRWFDGWRTRQPTVEDRRPVARARTWLLHTGWRQHGLLDAAEVPGPG
jgi:REP element-mobilizing transposase RayT